MGCFVVIRWVYVADFLLGTAAFAQGGYAAAISSPIGRDLESARKSSTLRPRSERCRTAGHLLGGLRIFYRRL